jgi:hypothetical protein
MWLVYETSEVIVVPSIQYRKGDQSDGLAMGMMYSRGLNLSFFVFFFGRHNASCFPFLHVQVD